MHVIPDPGAVLQGPSSNPLVVGSQQQSAECPQVMTVDESIAKQTLSSRCDADPSARGRVCLHGVAQGQRGVGAGHAIELRDAAVRGPHAERVADGAEREGGARRSRPHPGAAHPLRLRGREVRTVEHVVRIESAEDYLRIAGMMRDWMVQLYWSEESKEKAKGMLDDHIIRHLTEKHNGQGWDMTWTLILVTCHKPKN